MAGDSHDSCLFRLESEAIYRDVRFVADADSIRILSKKDLERLRRAGPNDDTSGIGSKPRKPDFTKPKGAGNPISALDLLQGRLRPDPVCELPVCGALCGKLDLMK